MHVKEWCTKPCTVATIGLILVGFGTLFMIFWPEIFDQQLANQLKLSPESKTYGPWKSPPIPMTLDIYLFNWTNSEDFLNSSTRPILQQLGPYVFTEKPDKVNITWHPENSTVTYMKKSRFYFDPVKSKGSLDDVITSLNVVPLAAAETTRYKSYMEQAKVNIGLQVYDQQLVVTKTANEFLFEGYEDDLVNAATQLSFLSDGQTVPFDRVGWFYMRNDTANLTGVYNVHTGENDIHQLGRLMNWNYADRTDFFAGECGMVNGSAGELFPPNVEKTNRMSLFTPDLCRSLPLDFEKEEMVHGLKGFKFSGGEKTVDNGTKYPENLCFNPGQEGIPSGVMNISACRFGTPVFMSFPHFYAADPFYVNQVGGMQPDEEKHKFFMTFEPKLGVALDVAARLQMNLLIRPHENIALFKNVPEVYFPILWFEQRVTMPPTLAEEMTAVYMVPKIGYGILGIIIFFGLVLICWFPVATLCGKRFDRTEKAPKQKTISTVEISETERPLMFQDQGRTKRSIEMEPVTKQYNFDSREASTADERFS